MFNLNNVYQLYDNLEYLLNFLSKEQINTHYNDHLLKYYALANKHVDINSLEAKADNLRELCKFCFGEPKFFILYNAIGQIINHIYFFESFNVSAKLDYMVIKTVKKEFDSFDKLRKKSYEIIDNHAFGSCWFWLIIDKNDECRVLITPTSFTIHNLDFVRDIVCCIDLWEHAYYLDYQSKRNLYFDLALKNSMKCKSLFN